MWGLFSICLHVSRRFIIPIAPNHAKGLGTHKKSDTENCPILMITKQCKTKGDTPILLPIFLWTANSDCTPCTKNRWKSWVVLGFSNTAPEFLGIVLFRMTFKAWWVGGGNAILKAVGLATWGKTILKYGKNIITIIGRIRNRLFEPNKAKVIFVNWYILASSFIYNKYHSPRFSCFQGWRWMKRMKRMRRVSQSCWNRVVASYLGQKLKDPDGSSVPKVGRMNC